MENLSWEAAFAIVGSVVAIVTALFGYLLKTRNVSIKKHYSEEEIKNLNSKISYIKDRLSELEGTSKVIITKTETTQTLLSQHEERDEINFSQTNKKIDKLTDVLMKILTDDKL